MKYALFFLMLFSLTTASVGSAAEERAAEWAIREKDALAAMNDASLEATLQAGESALSALFAEIKTEGESDALASTRIAALSQYVMRPGRGAVRETYADALLRAAQTAKNADVTCFFLNQLRWCGLARQADAIRALKQSSDASVAAFAEMVAQAVTDDRASKASSVAETRCAALNRELTALGSEARMPVLLKAFDDPDPAYVGVALTWARTSGGKADTLKWVEKLTACNDPVRRTMLLDLLAARNDPAAADAVVVCLSDPDVGVSSAAWHALIALDVNAFLKTLPDLLKTLPDDRFDTLRDDLLLLDTAPIIAPLARAFDVSGNMGKRMALEVLGTRRVAEGLPLAWRALDDNDETLAVAAFRFLREMAGPQDAARLVEKMLASQGRVTPEAQRAVTAAARRDTDGVYAKALLEALRDGADTQKATVFETLARVGGDALLKPVEDAAGGDNATLSAAAVRALADWIDAASVPALLRLALTAPDARRRTLALRGVSSKIEKDEDVKKRASQIWKDMRGLTGDEASRTAVDALFAQNAGGPKQAKSRSKKGK